MKKNKNNQKVNALYFLISGIPMLAYPLVILGILLNATDIFGMVWLWLAACYPIIFFLCLFLFYISKEIRLKKLFLNISFIYLGLVVLLFLFIVQFVLTLNAVIFLVICLFLFYISKNIISLEKIFLNSSVICVGLIMLLILLGIEQFVLFFIAIIILVYVLYFLNVDINMRKNKNNQKVSALYFLISGIPLPFLPFIFIFLTFGMASAPLILSRFMVVFLKLNLYYPIIFFLCLFLFFISREISLKKRFIIIPFIYLGFLGLYFFSIFLALILQSTF